MEILWITNSVHTSGSPISVVFVVGGWSGRMLFRAGFHSHQQIINCVEQTIMVSVIIITTKTHNNNSYKD